MGNMRFKVGDRVRIKSIDWYNKNKDKNGVVLLTTQLFTLGMSQFCGKVMTIENVEDIDNNVVYYMEEIDYDWTDEMIEGLAEDEVGLVDNLSSRWVNEFDLPEGYQFKDENGNVINATKIVLEKKKKEYPKTYCECKDILGLWDIDDTERGYYKTDLIDKLQMLLICRDAYWKIAGEEMGLDGPWEPDWTDEHQVKYTIYTMGKGVIRHVGNYIHAILAFPTEEMRDAFKENFDPDIEFCKELL